MFNSARGEIQQNCRLEATTIIQHKTISCELKEIRSDKNGKSLKSKNWASIRLKVVSHTCSGACQVMWPRQRHAATMDCHGCTPCTPGLLPRERPLSSQWCLQPRRLGDGLKWAESISECLGECLDSATGQCNNLRAAHRHLDSTWHNHNRQNQKKEKKKKQQIKIACHELWTGCQVENLTGLSTISSQSETTKAYKSIGSSIVIWIWIAMIWHNLARRRQSEAPGGMEVACKIINVLQIHCLHPLAVTVRGEDYRNWQYAYTSWLIGGYIVL